MFGASKSGQVPSTPDPQFNYVTALLHGDGTNGAQNNTFVDSSSNAFSITRNGTTTQGSFSPYGSNWSNYFPSSSYFSLTNTSAMDFGTGDFTFETWLYLTSYPEAYQIIVDIGGTNPAYLGTVGVTSTTYKVDISNNVQDAVSTSILNINTWYHIAGVRSSGSVKIYINGVLDSTTAFAGQTGRATGTTAIGYGLSFGGYSVRGYVSNLRLVKGTAVYTSNFTPSTTPLTAVSGTSLLTCQSNRFIDNSTNTYALTPTGTPSVQRFNPFLPTSSQAYSTSVYGGSGYFNGSTDFLNIALNSNLNLSSSDYTMEFWVYPNSFSATNVPLAYGWSSSGGARLIVFAQNTDGTFQVYYYNASNNFTSSNKVTLNQWNHVALVRNGSTFTLYINGVSGASASNSTSYTDLVYPVIIGSSWNGSTGATFYNGYISDVRVVIGTAVYTSNFTPPTSPLTAITNTQLLTNMTNAGIYDNAMMEDWLTVGSAQVSTSVKKYGTGSLSFPTTGDYLSSLVAPTSSFGTGNFTVEGWMYFNTVGSDMTLFTGATSGDVSIRIVSSQIRIGILSVSWDTASATQSFSTGTWYHFAVVRNAGTITFYLNGTSIGSGANTNAYNVTNVATIAQTGGGAHLDGYIDDLRITKGYARYTANFTPPTSAFPNY